jgi:hypothetical protein
METTSRFVILSAEGFYLSYRMYWDDTKYPDSYILKNLSYEKAFVDRAVKKAKAEPWKTPIHRMCEVKEQDGILQVVQEIPLSEWKLTQEEGCLSV